MNGDDLGIGCLVILLVVALIILGIIIGSPSEFSKNIHDRNVARCAVLWHDARTTQDTLATIRVNCPEDAVYLKPTAR